MLNRASPDRKSRRVTGILKALLTGPGLDQRAIHREVLVGKIRLGLLQYPHFDWIIVFCLLRA